MSKLKCLCHYNRIRCIEIFLPRSTRENVLSQKERNKREKAKAKNEAAKTLSRGI